MKDNINKYSSPGRSRAKKRNVNSRRNDQIVGKSRRRRESPARAAVKRLSAFLVFVNMLLLAVAVVLIVREHGVRLPLGISGGEKIASSDPYETVENTEFEEIQEKQVSGSESEAAFESLSESTESPEPEYQESPITMLFGGDVYLSSYVLSSYDNAGGISGNLSESYRELTDSTDFFMVNEEFPMSERGSAADDKEFTFRVAPERVSILKEMGVDAVTLANNHVLDFGRDALTDTIAALDSAGIAHTGAGENRAEASEAVIWEKDGRRIAVLGATRVMPFSDWAAGSQSAGVFPAYDAYKSDLLSKITELSETCDYVIVYMHWGTERKEEPDPYMRTLAEELASSGADLIVGAHPHVLQGTEYIGDVPVVYSLGNFLFGSSIPRTMLLEVKYYPDTGRSELRLYPGSSALGYTKAMTAGNERQDFFNYYEGISYGISIDEEGNISREENQPAE